MRNVSVSEARRNFAEIINQVAYGSERFFIRKSGKPVAVIVNVKDIVELKKKRKTKFLSRVSGTITLPKEIDLKPIFEAVKEPYDLKSLLGR